MLRHFMSCGCEWTEDYKVLLHRCTAHYEDRFKQ